MILRFVILFSLIAFLTSHSRGQQEKVSDNASKDWKLNIIYDSDIKWLKRTNYKSDFNDSLSMMREVRAVLDFLYKKSYFSASADSIVCDTDGKCNAFIHLGELLQWARLNPGNMEEEVLSKTGYRDKIYRQRRFRYRQFGRFMESILVYYENNGYPFVSLRLDSIEHFRNEGIKATLHLEKNKYTEIDTVEIYGDNVVARNYLYNYLNVKPHKPYDEENIAAISDRLADLTFVGEAQPPRVIFTDNETKLQLNLKKKRASRFDGIIGLLQDEETGVVQFTGDIKLNLTNAFRRGETIGLNWRGLPNNTQDLNLRFNYPYLFNTPFGADVQFQLYRRDTTFLDIISTFGLQYFVNARDYLKVLYQNHQSNLLSTSQYENATSLPQVLDFRTNLYGAEINLNKLDYLLNPRKGLNLNINGRAGFKSIQKNPGIPDSLYDGFELNNVVYRGELLFQYFIPLAKRHVFYIGNKSAFIENEQILFNELYRIGGLRTLRGFDEETIFVSLYAINTFEYRFILEKNSNLNVFLDYAYIERKLYNEDFFADRPFGFGVGSTFETGAGIFSISYAVGSQQGNPIDLRGAKVHFGFLNYF